MSELFVREAAVPLNGVSGRRSGHIDDPDGTGVLLDDELENLAAGDLSVLIGESFDLCSCPARLGERARPAPSPAQPRASRGCARPLSAFAWPPQQAGEEHRMIAPRDHFRGGYRPPYL